MIPESENCFHRQMFFRKPDWRYLRAKAILQSAGNDRALGDDSKTIRLFRFLKLQARRMDARTRPSRSPCEQIFKAALRLYLEPTFTRLTLEIELRVLSGQEQGEISRCTGLPVDLIQHYEEIFFDIRDRLSSREYIYSMAIGDTETTPTGLRKLAYEIGQPIIDVLLFITPRFVAQDMFAGQVETVSLEKQPTLRQLATDPVQQIGNYIREIVRPQTEKTGELSMATHRPERNLEVTKHSCQEQLPDLLQLASRIAG